MVKNVGVGDVFYRVVDTGGAWKIQGFGEETKVENMAVLEIPKEIEGSPVRSIGEGAFQFNENIEEVVLPEGLKYVNKNAFLMCKNLKKVIFPDTLCYIGDTAFSHVDITFLDLGKGEVTFGNSVFAYCPSLSTVYMPAKVVDIGEKMFSYCINLVEVYIPEHMDTVGVRMFENCMSLRWVDLTEGIKWIRDGAFENCYNLKDATIPNGAISVGNRAFFNCISINELRLGTGVKRVGISAFENCKKLKEVTGAEGLVCVDYRAFANCELLKRFPIGEHMSEFAEKVFVGSTLLGEFIADNNIHFSGDARGIIRGDIVEKRPVQVVLAGGDWLEEGRLVRVITKEVQESVSVDDS